MSPPPEPTQGPFFHRPELAIALAALRNHKLKDFNHAC